jgi:hypothetical protein
VRVREPRSRQASIIGGSKDREVTAFAVAPEGPDCPMAVTTVTPVANALSADRNSSEDTAMGERYGTLAYDPAACEGLSY